MEEDGEIDEIIAAEEVNCQFKPDEIPNWKLYYSYTGYDYSNKSEKYPHVYQLLFVFSTGTLDEFSCALICDLFLNILDCAIKDVPFQYYSNLKMYDIGKKVEDNINLVMHKMKQDKNYKEFECCKNFSKMLTGPCSNFDFQRKELKNKKNFFTTRCFLSVDDTQAFFSICKKKDIGVYAVFIVIINNLLFHHAVKNGFEGVFSTRVLNIINARCIFKRVDKKYDYKLGCYSLPYVLQFKLESTEVDEIFKEAPIIERKLDKATMKNLFWGQEAVRNISIKASGNKHRSGKCNPHYCFSVTNLGNLSCYYAPESPKNSIRLLSYERYGSVLEGGQLDVIFHTLNGKLTVYFDFSNECFNHNEMSDIILTFRKVIRSIV